MWEYDQSKFDVSFLTKIAEKFEVDPMDLLPNGSTLKIVNNTDNKDTSINAFEVILDPKELIKDLLESKNELLETKNELIKLLRRSRKLYKKKI